MHLATLWEAIAARLPEQQAVVHGDRRLTFSQLEHRAARLAGALSGLGVPAGGKVALYLYNGPEFTEVTFAAFKARLAPVNVNYRYIEAELEYLLENADAEVLFFHGSLADRVAAVRDRLPKLRAVVQA